MYSSFLSARGSSGGSSQGFGAFVAATGGGGRGRGSKGGGRGRGSSRGGGRGRGGGFGGLKGSPTQSGSGNAAFASAAKPFKTSASDTSGFRSSSSRRGKKLKPSPSAFAAESRGPPRPNIAVGKGNRSPSDRTNLMFMSFPQSRGGPIRSHSPSTLATTLANEVSSEVRIRSFNGDSGFAVVEFKGGPSACTIGMRAARNGLGSYSYRVHPGDASKTPPVSKSVTRWVRPTKESSKQPSRSHSSRNEEEEEEEEEEAADDSPTDDEDHVDEEEFYDEEEDGENIEEEDEEDEEDEDDFVEDDHKDDDDDDDEEDEDEDEKEEEEEEDEEQERKKRLLRRRTSGGVKLLGVSEEDLAKAAAPRPFLGGPPPASASASSPPASKKGGLQRNKAVRLPPPPPPPLSQSKSSFDENDYVNSHDPRPPPHRPNRRAASTALVDEVCGHHGNFNDDFNSPESLQGREDLIGAFGTLEAGTRAEGLFGSLSSYGQAVSIRGTFSCYFAGVCGSTQKVYVLRGFAKSPKKYIF